MGEAVVPRGIRSLTVACAGSMDASQPCPGSVEPDSPVPLCQSHLLAAHDWVAGRVGVTDLLPSPCLACGSRLGVRFPSGWLCAVCEWRLGDVPDGGLSTVRVDVVYYLRSKNRVKIGTSANPRGRLAQLSFDELIAFERGDRHLERRRHEQFAGHRVPRIEWFDLHPELLSHLDAVSAGQSDPWGTYARWVSEAIALRG